MPRKLTNTPPRYCWDCAHARPNEDENYRTPEGKPIFYNCYANPDSIKRGLMDNTIACKLFKHKSML